MVLQEGIVVEGDWNRSRLLVVVRKILFLPVLLLLVQCGGSDSRSGGGKAAVPSRGQGLQQIINVSAYDPKERQRSGRGYTQYNVSALRANGAQGLIARAGKGGNLDTKCANFIKSADRAGLLAGVYYRVQKHRSIRSQADQFVNRAKWLAARRPAGVAPLLLCGDYDGDLSLSQIVAFMDRVEERTGVIPVAYLENSQELKLQTRAANSRIRSKLRRAPYWLALYSNTSGDGPIFSAPGNPRGLVKQYRMWSDWTMWQYGGVEWEGGRSKPKVYHHGRYRFPRYFGNMDRPLERNVFKGSRDDLRAFWTRHGFIGR